MKTNPHYVVTFTALEFKPTLRKFYHAKRT